MRECRRRYEAGLKSIEILDRECAHAKLQLSKKLGPRRMEVAIRDARTHGIEIENFTLTLRKNSLFAVPSISGATFIKTGDRFRVGDCPTVYRANKNSGIPSTLDKIALKLRRVIVATMLHLEAARNEARTIPSNTGDTDLDMANFKAAAQKAEAEFQVDCLMS